MTTDFRALCEELVEELEAWIGYGDEADCADAHVVVDRARAALAEQPVGPTPIPVAERLPGPEDLNGIIEECWWYDHACWYLDTYQANYTHWLPVNALPLPPQ
jgi:hypothetical protein